ncbi:hypothetical protein STENM327S_00312 [Streptomyces tendae]
METEIVRAVDQMGPYVAAAVAAYRANVLSRAEDAARRCGGERWTAPSFSESVGSRAVRDRPFDHPAEAAQAGALGPASFGDHRPCRIPRSRRNRRYLAWW